jgi:hypothetical protein
MKEIPINEYLEEHTQAELAGCIGASAGAVSQWMKAGKTLFVVVDRKGVAQKVIEHRRLPVKPTAA